MRLADNKDLLAKSATVADLTIRGAAELVSEVSTTPRPNRVFYAWRGEPSLQFLA